MTDRALEAAPHGAPTNAPAGVPRGLNAPADASAERTPSLSATVMAALIERQIVPRLWSLKRPESVGDGPSIVATAGFTLDEFAAAVLKEEPDSIDRRIAEMMRNGVSAETVFLDWLAPAARRLGQWWEEDRVSFTDVTIGLGTLHRVLHRTAARARAPHAVRLPRGSVYFATVPGEQHGFGVAMLEEVFQLGGWQTLVDLNADRASILRTVGEQFFDIVGFSASRAEHLPALAELIAELRRQSRNRSVQVMVGGAVFLEDGSRAAQVGADSTAGDAQKAFRWAEQKRGSDACTEESSRSI